MIKRSSITHYFLLIACLFFVTALFANDIKMKISSHYLNIPIGYHARMKLVELRLDGKLKRNFPVQLAEDSIGYWIYIDVSEFKGKTISIACPAKNQWLKRIYQSDRINGWDSLYKESNRPQFHFTVKRGWSNDVNGPIYLNNEYHLFWQSFPFGLSWNTGYMYWGHAVSKDLLHWVELPIAMMLDSLGSPWSGSAVVDKNNDAGFGKNALVVYYTAFDVVSGQQVQCIAYSNDNGKTFKRYQHNPIIDSNWELGTTQTRDPKILWYEPAKTWVLVLFENDGMSFFNSSNMRDWKRQSHFPGLEECPDFFELPVDGDMSNKKWVLHGGSSAYYIGHFDGKVFTPETGKLNYAEGLNINGDDILYAAQSFSEMPDGRRVQMAWGRIEHPGMPFTQMMLFPVAFSLKTTLMGIRLLASPIKEIADLHKNPQHWGSVTMAEANEKLKQIKGSCLHMLLRFQGDADTSRRLALQYNGTNFINMPLTTLDGGIHEMELLIDKTSAEIFIDGGRKYILRQLVPSKNKEGLQFVTGLENVLIDKIDIYELNSIWDNAK
ncbi:MAG: glycoside hydrolase family 32 protein [Bacteroidetes bacterium]|nr:glycoside hydrolase family 32 protein [Bacteroidota bacterium]